MNSISNISSLLFLRSLCKKSVHLQRHILYCILCSGFPWDVDGLELKLSFMAGRCPWLRLFQPQNGSSNSARCSKMCSWGTVKVLVSAGTQSVLQAEPPASQTRQTRLASVRVCLMTNPGGRTRSTHCIHFSMLCGHAACCFCYWCYLWKWLTIFHPGVLALQGLSGCLRCSPVLSNAAAALLLWGHCPRQTLHLNVSPSP